MKTACWQIKFVVGFYGALSKFVCCEGAPCFLTNLDEKEVVH
jgi:hypothetical protein